MEEFWTDFQTIFIIYIQTIDPMLWEDYRSVGANLRSPGSPPSQARHRVCGQAHSSDRSWRCVCARVCGHTSLTGVGDVCAAAVSELCVLIKKSPEVEFSSCPRTAEENDWGPRQKEFSKCLVALFQCGRFFTKALDLDSLRQHQVAVAQKLLWKF